MLAGSSKGTKQVGKKGNQKSISDIMNEYDDGDDYDDIEGLQ